MNHQIITNDEQQTDPNSPTAPPENLPGDNAYSTPTTQQESTYTIANRKGPIQYRLHDAPGVSSEVVLSTAVSNDATYIRGRFQFLAPRDSGPVTLTIGNAIGTSIIKSSVTPINDRRLQVRFVISAKQLKPGDRATVNISCAPHPRTIILEWIALRVRPQKGKTTDDEIKEACKAVEAVYNATQKPTIDRTQYDSLRLRLDESSRWITKDSPLELRWLKASVTLDALARMQPLLNITRLQRIKELCKKLNDPDKSFSGFVNVLHRRTYPLTLSQGGYQRSLRVEYKEVAADIYLERLLTGINAAGYEAFVTGGALLGFCRDKELIPHDDKIKICILLKARVAHYAAQEWLRLESTLQSIERAVTSTIYSYHLRLGNITFDFYPAYIAENDRAYLWPTTFGSLDRADILPLCSVEWLGVQLQVPRHSEAILESIYGPEWRLCDPLYKFNWETANAKWRSFLNSFHVLESLTPEAISKHADFAGIDELSVDASAESPYYTTASSQSIFRGAGSPFPLFSIIIPAYNVARYIKGCLQSILSSGFESYEVIVVDDGSTDSTHKQLSVAADSFPQLQILYQRNQGQSAARNNGLRHARGDYVIFLDADDALTENSLKTFADLSKDNVDIIFGGRVKIRESTGEIKLTTLFEDRLNIPIAKARRVLDILAVHGKAFRRNFLLKNDLFFKEGTVWEDHDFSYRTYLTASRISTTSKAVYLWTERADDTNPSTMQRLLTPLSILSRFEQIKACNSHFNHPNWTERFGTGNWLKGEFERSSRLLSHVGQLVRKGVDEHISALNALSEGLSEIRSMMRENTHGAHRLIYEAVLSRDTEALERSWRLLWTDPEADRTTPKTTSLSNHKLHAETLLRIKSRIKNGLKVRIGFYVSEKAKWNSQALFNRLKNDSRFDTSIVLLSYGKHVDDRLTERDLYLAQRDFFRAIDPNLYEAYDTETMRSQSPLQYDFDLIFLQQPWGMDKLPRQLLGTSLTMFMHYGYMVTDNPKLHYELPHFHAYLWRYISQSELHRKAQIKRLPRMARNIVVCGYPKLDDFSEPVGTDAAQSFWGSKPWIRRVIYAPHQSIGPKSLVRLSTFDWNYATFAELARSHQEVAWVYKPHPNMKLDVERHGLMTYDDYLQYEKAWATGANTKVMDSGGYLPLFRTSDVLITDCGSFLGEYMATGKPIIRLISRNNPVPLNEIGEAINSVSYQARTVDDIRELFQQVVLDGDDPLKVKRQAVCTQMFGHGFCSSQLIIDHLDSQLFDRSAA